MVRPSAYEAEAGPKLASIGRRTLATLVDGAVLLVVAIAIGRAGVNAGLYSGAPNSALWLYPVGAGLAVIAYQIGFLLAMHSTPGMGLCRISVAGSDGRSASAGQMAVRVLVSVLSAGCLGAGYWWAVFHRRRQTWHDLAANTVVILGSPKAKPAPLPPRQYGGKTYRVG